MQAPDRRHRRDEVGKRVPREQLLLRRELDGAAAGMGHVQRPGVDGPLGAAPNEEAQSEGCGDSHQPPDTLCGGPQVPVLEPASDSGAVTKSRAHERWSSHLPH